jgi:hypothetical protein
MNWLILISDVAFAFVAAILAAQGLRTLKAIKHLGIGKSFWIPVIASGALFLIGSVFGIFHEIAVELDLSLTINTDEIIHVSWLLALCLLMGSIYSYSRKVKTIKKFPVPEKKEFLISELRKVKESFKKETSTECKFQFGYLSTFSKDASIPEECLGCQRIVQCKYFPEQK